MRNNKLIKTEDKLKAISALTSVFLAINQETNAQIVYHDIDPDVVLAFNGDNYELDIDGDGLPNFHFLKWSWYDSSSWWAGEFTSEKHIIILGEEGDNFIAASTAWTYVCSSCSTTFVAAYALDSDIMINEEFDFFQYGDMVYLENSYYAVGGWGNWFPDTEDKYLGIYFEDTAAVGHFGWIRCSVMDEYVLTIKEYAFEGLPEVPIITGDIGACYSPVPIGTSGITSSSAKPKWESVPSADYYKLQYRIVGTFSWTTKTVDYPKTFRKLTGLDCNTEYEWRITAACTDGSVTGWSPLQNFTTASCRLENEGAIDEENITIYTHSNQIYVSIDEDLTEPANLMLYDQLGRIVFEEQVTQEQNVFSMDIPDGIYIVTLSTGSGTISKALPVFR